MTKKPHASPIATTNRYECWIEHGPRLFIDAADHQQAEQEYLRRVHVISTPNKVTVIDAPPEPAREW